MLQGNWKVNNQVDQILSETTDGSIISASNLDWTWSTKLHVQNVDVIS